MQEDDIEQELRQIVKEEVANSIPPIAFPDVQRVEVVNFPEQKAPIVNVPEPRVTVNVPEPRVNVTVPEPRVLTDNSEVVKAVNNLSSTIEKNKTSNEDILEALDDVASRLETSYKEAKVVGSGAGGIGSYIYDSQSTPINPATKELQSFTGIYAADSASVDAFSRWRTSEPNYVFDTNFQYDLQPLVFEAVTAQSGATVTHESLERSALMTFANTPTGGKAYMQTYEWFRYQAGRSQMVLLTFNLLGGVANTKKFVGYSDGNNGIELQLNGTQPRLALLSDTAKDDEFVNQADWNIDPMNGTGASGITLNFSKTNILVIDFQWLGVGRVRVGFDIDGLVYYVHQFDHANHQDVAYMQTANLPVRAGMTCTGTVSTTMRFICASVTSEGGETDVGGYNFSVEGTGTAGSNARAHILSVRPLTTFNSIANRSKFVLESVEVLVTGAQPVEWELVLGQAISGTTAFNPVNSTYSGMEFNTLGTISNAPTIVIASGYVASTAANRGSISKLVGNKYPITLDAAGAVRSLGTLSVVASGIGGTSACRAVLNWREIR